jgi:quercetin dioxygenase-like cupin family protein
VPAHVHDGEDELFYVVCGDLRGFCGEKQWSASAGSFILLPRNVEHGFTVSRASDAKVLVILGPPRFDAHVAQRGTPIRSDK